MPMPEPMPIETARSAAAQVSLSCVVCDRDFRASAGDVVAVVVAVGAETMPRAAICPRCLPPLVGAWVGA